MKLLIEFEVNGVKFEVNIPDPKNNTRLEAVLPGEKAIRFNELFIVESYSKVASKLRYDITYLDEKENNHLILASIWMHKKI